jgi:hypothetical protein
MEMTLGWTAHYNNELESDLTALAGWKVRMHDTGENCQAARRYVLEQTPTRTRGWAISSIDRPLRVQGAASCCRRPRGLFQPFLPMGGGGGLRSFLPILRRVPSGRKNRITRW